LALDGGLERAVTRRVGRQIDSGQAPHGSFLLNSYGMYAMQSISTLTPLRGAAASTVVRAGWTPLKYSLKTRLNTGKSSMLRRNTPTLTTCSIDVPPASSTALIFSSVTRVCSARSCETTSLVTGSSGPCPETKRNWPHLTPWAMGDSMPSENPVFGAAFVYTTSGFMPTRVSCIDASLPFEAHRDLLREWLGGQPP